MREILFRAKRKNWSNLPKNEWWVEGIPIEIKDKMYMAVNYVDCEQITDFEMSQYILRKSFVEIDPETLCQYTGLTDKNGKRIWENDIVRIENSMDEGIGNIEFYGGMWYVDGEPSNSLYDIVEYDDAAEGEVIGNIFDNPELLKGE